MKNKSTKQDIDFMISNYWIFSDLRKIIISEYEVEKIITTLNKLDHIKNEKNLINLINDNRDICYSISILQRSKLLELLTNKICDNITSKLYKKHLKSLMTFAYSLILYGNRDYNNMSKEMVEISNSIKLINSSILFKIKSMNNLEESISHLFLFGLTFVKQIKLFLEWSKFEDFDMPGLLDKDLTNKDKISKSMRYLYNRLCEPIGNISIKSSRSFDHVLISSFYGFINEEDLVKLFNEEKTVVSKSLKRFLQNDDVQNAKIQKVSYSIHDIISEMDSKNFMPIKEKSEELSLSCDNSDFTKQEIIELLKLTPLIIMNCKKFLDNDKNNNSVLDHIYINLLKLWVIGFKLKILDKSYLELYFWPFVTLDIKATNNFRGIIVELLAFIMEFQSKSRMRILTNPFWVMDILTNCLESVLYHSSAVKNVSADNKKLEFNDLVSEIGKVFEVLCRPQDKEHWCRVIIVVPQRLFAFIANLENPVQPDVIRTLKRTVLSPIMEVANKYAVQHMKVLVKGAAKEVCKNLLEIK